MKQLFTHRRAEGSRCCVRNDWMRVPLSYIFSFLSFPFFFFVSPPPFPYSFPFFVTRIDVFSAILRQDTHSSLSTSFESIESRIELSPLKIRRSREFDLDISIVRANDLYTFFRLDLENSLSVPSVDVEIGILSTSFVNRSREFAADRIFEKRLVLRRVTPDWLFFIHFFGRARSRTGGL